MTSPRSIAWLCLAVLCMAALTPAAMLLLCAVVLPFCFAFSLAVPDEGLVDRDRGARLSGFVTLLSARAPPAVS